ncbi:MAG: PAS domain-containing protein [Flavisolibacter sp.]
MEGAQQGVWDWNILTGECFYSEGYKKLYGYEPGELHNRIEEWEALIHPEDKLKMKEAVNEHISTDNPFHESTYRIKTKNGQYKWILARGMIIERDVNDRAVRMIGTHTDITEQVNAREKLRQSEEYYRNLFQSNPLPCWIYDTQTLAFLDVNQAAINHYGFSREEFLSSDLFLFHAPESYKKLRERVQNEYLYNIQHFNKWMHRKKNGEEIFVDIDINTIQYGKVNAKLVVAHDITEKVKIEKAQKKTEEELRRSNERFKLASMATSDAIYDWDLLTNQLLWGEGLQNLFGLDPVDITIDKWKELIHPEDQPLVKSSLEASINSQTKWQMKYRFKDAKGEYRFVLDRGFITRNTEGKALSMIGSLQDISDLHMKETELLISNERYRYATLATSDVVWDMDLLEGTVVFSDNFQKLLGWPLPENNTIALDQLVRMVLPDENQYVNSKLNEVIKDPDKTYWAEEFTVKKADGSYCYINDRGYIIRNEKKEAIRVIGAFQDITERNYYEQLLSLERSVFELSNNINVSMFDIANKLLTGVETIIPDSFTSVVLLKENGTIEALAAPRLPKAFTNSLNNLKIGPVAGSCGTSMYRAETVITEDIEQDPLWEQYVDYVRPFGLKACWSLPIINGSGKVLGSFAIYYKEAKSPSAIELDTIERIRNILRVLMEHFAALEEIKQANERFDIMMMATHDLVWDWNLETNEVYRDAVGLKNVYGLEKNDPIHNIQEWLERIHPEDHNKVEKVMHEIIKAKDQSTFDVEYRFLRDDGTYSYVYDRGKIIRNQQGKPIRMIGAAQDITLRKKLEQKLLHNELGRQKAINQATVDTQEQERGEIGKELHDNVNQVLTTTKLYLDLALSNAELKDDLINKSIQNVTMVINEIRQLSRSLMDPSIGDLGLVDSIHDLIDNINLTRKLKAQLDADKKIEDYLDKNHKLTVFRIIQEAMNNAINHAKASTVKIGLKKNRNKAELVIEDNGIGFNPQLIKKGAGLKNIQNRIYLINGKQQIISAPGAGCKIIIEFPINKKQI